MAPVSYRKSHLRSSAVDVGGWHCATWDARLICQGDNNSHNENEKAWRQLLAKPHKMTLWREKPLKQRLNLGEIIFSLSDMVCHTNTTGKIIHPEYLMAIEKNIQSGTRRYGSTLISLTGYSFYVESAPTLRLYAVDPPWSLITGSNRLSVIYSQVIVLNSIVHFWIIVTRT